MYADRGWIIYRLRGMKDSRAVLGTRRDLDDVAKSGELVLSGGRVVRPVFCEFVTEGPSWHVGGEVEELAVYPERRRRLTMGEMVRARREKLGLTQRQLEERAGVPLSLALTSRLESQNRQNFANSVEELRILETLGLVPL